MSLGDQRNHIARPVPSANAKGNRLLDDVTIDGSRSSSAEQGALNDGGRVKRQWVNRVQ